MEALLEEHRPQAVALEQLYFGQNVRTAFAVGQARGVAMLAAGQRGVECFSYTPQQVKGAVCGNGRAPKEQVGRMVAALLVARRAAAPRPRRRRARGGRLPRQPRAAGAGAGGSRAAMIDLLQGELAVRGSDHVVVLCSGVGYRAAVSAQTLQRMPARGETVTLHTHLISREDALTLYGFHSEHERELFQMLLTVQAVGPKVALAVLSVTPPPELVAVLAAGDADRLRAVPGIGKRTAERIIVELREKVAPGDAGSARPRAAGGPPRARREPADAGPGRADRARIRRPRRPTSCSPTPTARAPRS